MKGKHKMKKKHKKDYTFIFLVLISVVNCIVMFFGTKFLSLKYALLMLDFIVIIFAKEEKILPILFFLHPNSALYDDIGFTYLFNFSVVICLFKMIIKKHYKMNKLCFILFFILICWELLLIFKSQLLDSSIFSLASWISSYLILLILSQENNIKFEVLYKYFFAGFILAFICGLSVPIIEWGVNNIPTAYRFIGLLRDPNYYSMDALLLIFSSDLYGKISRKSSVLRMVIIFIMGIFSVSKAFIILLTFGSLLKVLSKYKKINIIKTVVAILIIIVIYIVCNKFGYIDLMFNKYIYRSDTTSLFTGRDYLFVHYLAAIFSSPFSMLFGNSALKYADVINVGVGDAYFTGYLAHNTYLDVILSWGILGSFLYIYFLKSVIKKNTGKIINAKRFDLDRDTIFIVFACGLFTLSYLSTDVFALIILYLIVYKNSYDSINLKKEKGKMKHDI